MDPASPNATTNKEEPYLFECGTPYRFTPPPMKEGLDCWEEILKPLKAYDDAQCKFWKEEVQNVLIFASLFSAVVTAFIIESYKELKPDPNDTAVALLSRIAARLDAAANASTPFDPVQSRAPFSPQPAMVRVNVFWILSLVFSLTTVLIGVVSSQWLREHQHYPEHCSFEEKFGLLHMRLEMIEAWKVPAFFASLPILLQLALILFFIGLADFLHSINVPQVTIPIIVAICLSLSFLLVTTALPALQVFTVTSPRTQMNKNVPVPCPYKSPQARLLRLVLGSTLGALFIQYTFISTYSLLVRCIKLARSLHRLHYRVFRSLQCLIAPNPSQDRLTGSSDHDTDYQPYYSSLEPVNVRSWEELDLEWISVRRNYSAKALSRNFFAQDGAFKKSTYYGPQYDQIRGIQRVCRRYRNHTTLLSAYHCFVRSIAGADVPAGLAEHDLMRRDSMASKYYQIAKELLMSSPAISWHLEEDSPNCADAGPGISYDEMFLVFVNRVLPGQRFVRPTLVEILYRTCHCFEDHQLAPAERQRRARNLSHNVFRAWGDRSTDFRRLENEYLGSVFHRLTQGQRPRIPLGVFNLKALTYVMEGFLAGYEVPDEAVDTLGKILDVSVNAVEDPSGHGFDLHDNDEYLNETALPFLLSYSLISAYLGLRRSSSLPCRIPSGVLELASTCYSFCQVMHSNRAAVHVLCIVRRMARFFLVERPRSLENRIWDITEEFKSMLQELRNSDNGASGAHLSSAQPAPGPSSTQLPHLSSTSDQEPGIAGIVAGGSTSSDANNGEQLGISTSSQDATTADSTSDNPYSSRDSRTSEDLRLFCRKRTD